MTRTRCSTSSPGARRKASSRRRGANSAARASASTSTRTSAASARCDNDYLQDREAMKHGSHTGIAGIPNQDIAMWETMGPIADRSRERLGASDIAIVAIPPHHGRCGARGARRRSGDRHVAAACPARQAQVVRGHRPQEHRLDDARRRARRSSKRRDVVVAPRREDIRAMRGKRLTPGEPHATLSRTPNAGAAAEDKRATTSPRT